MTQRHILRVDMVNGLHLEFGFDDPATAGQVQETLHDAMGTTDVVSVTDNQGRHSVILGSNLQHTMLVDLSVEVGCMVGQQVWLEQAKKEAVAAATAPRIIGVRQAILDQNGTPAIPGVLRGLGGGGH